MMLFLPESYISLIFILSLLTAGMSRGSTSFVCSTSFATSSAGVGCVEEVEEGAEGAEGPEGGEWDEWDEWEGWEGSSSASSN